MPSSTRATHHGANDTDSNHDDRSPTTTGGQHLRRRAPPQGDREERTGTVGTPAATPPNQGGGEERTGAVGTSAAAPPNQVGREGKTGTTGSLAAAPPKRVVGEDKTGAADKPAAAPPNQVHREERTGTVDTPAAAGLGAGRRKATGAETTNAANEPRTPHGSTPVAAAAHVADVNTPLGTTHGSKGVGPVNTTKGTGLQGPRRAPTEVTEGEGHMTLGAVPAAEGANPAASGNANTPHNARGTLREHPNGTDAPTQSRTASRRNENVPTFATPCTCLKEPPKTAVGSPGHPEGTRKGTARSGANTPPPTCGGGHAPKPLPP